MGVGLVLTSTLHGRRAPLRTTRVHYGRMWWRGTYEVMRQVDLADGRGSSLEDSGRGAKECSESASAGKGAWVLVVSTPIVRPLRRNVDGVKIDQKHCAFTSFRQE